AGPATVEGVTRLDALSPDALRSAIVVEEMGGDATNTARDEAAILYANGQIDATEQTLKALLENRDPRIWAMLFDLYRLTARQREFENLAMDYALKFETSPPLWPEDEQALEETDTDVVVVALPRVLDMSAAQWLAEQIGAAGKDTPLRLDFSRTGQIESAGAERIAQILNQTRKGKHKLQISGIRGLIQILQAQTESQAAQTGPWLLLLAVYHLLGRQEEFEDLAVNYAVCFEVSPPSWEATAVAKEVVARPPVAKDACVWSGIIGGEQAEVYNQLLDYARARNPVVVDLSAVTRIDYASVSGLISTLMNILGNGKTIILQGQNTLVDALLHSMGVQHMAELRPVAPV
ncbi:MAG TPA: STAS domain-containing protein, partial [Thiobacillaceae bacterium]|nr:STAS domain-containing protein [Thiobacillaceae bacterium]